ncbi:hypothetical protein GCM10010331_46830 [Streptomyces xanthochromogenes]|nr:hypothetical protein GCM10010331_46830 [Streptomyces xanthochromogenes]
MKGIQVSVSEATARRRAVEALRRRAATAAPNTRTAALPTAATTVPRSDGIATRRVHTPSLSMLRLPPQLLAASVTHRARSTRDDATLLALRPQQRHS